MGGHVGESLVPLAIGAHTPRVLAWVALEAGEFIRDVDERIGGAQLDERVRDHRLRTRVRKGKRWRAGGRVACGWRGIEYAAQGSTSDLGLGLGLGLG
jgi:hypothetical protein